MKTVKVFEFSELPEVVSDYVFNLAISMIGGYAMDYCAFKYNIGRFVDEYEKASDKDNYDLEEVEKTRLVDNWFLTQGCKNKEVIYLEL